MRDVDISLVSLFFYALKRWKSILGGAIIGTILLTALAATKQSDVPSTEIPSTEIIVNGTLAFMVEADNSEELTGIHNAYCLSLKSNELSSYISELTEIPFDEMSKYISVEGASIVSGDSTAAFVVNISGVTEEQFEHIRSALLDYTEKINYRLNNNGYMHNLTVINDQSKTEESISNEEVPAIPENNIDPDNHLIRGTISKKSLLVGAILGLLIVLAWHSAIFVFSNKLDIEDDVERLFGTYLIGVVPGQDYGKLFYKLRHIGKRTNNQDESVKLVSAKIKIAAQKNGIKKIGIIGCGLKKYSETIVDKMTSYLKNEGIDTIVVDDPLYNPENASCLSDVDHAILLEKSGITFRTEVFKEVELAHKFDIKLEGMVIAE